MTEAYRDPAELEQVILRLLSQRSAQGSICPSDVARAARAQGWRALMDEVRAAAGRLAARGEVDITQGGRVVDIATARGRCGSTGTRGAERCGRGRQRRPVAGTSSGPEPCPSVESCGR